MLGADGCRYARTELAGAITSFGKVFLTAARDFFEARGLRTLYGDTDSVFVLSGLDDGAGFEDLTAFGAREADALNAAIAGRKDERLFATASDGHQEVAVCEAILKSNQSKSWVRV